MHHTKNKMPCNSNTMTEKRVKILTYTHVLHQTNKLRKRFPYMQVAEGSAALTSKTEIFRCLQVIENLQHILLPVGCCTPLQCACYPAHFPLHFLASSSSYPVSICAYAGLAINLLDNQTINRWNFQSLWSLQSCG